MTKTTRMVFSEPQVRMLLASVRNKIDAYEADLEDLDDANEPEPREWYLKQLAELHPLERRLNAAGLRLIEGEA